MDFMNQYANMQDYDASYEFDAASYQGVQPECEVIPDVDVDAVAAAEPEPLLKVQWPGRLAEPVWLQQAS